MIDVVADYPKRAEEPMLGLMITYHGDGGWGTSTWPGQGWVALCWRPDRPASVSAYGPFRTMTLAKEFGRRHFPRRYRVCGMHDPERLDKKRPARRP